MNKTEKFIQDVAHMQTASFKTNNPEFNKAVINAVIDIAKLPKEKIKDEFRKRIEQAVVQHLYKNENPTSLKTTATPLHDALQLLMKSQNQKSELKDMDKWREKYM